MNSDLVESVGCQLIIFFSFEMYHNDQWCMIHSGNAMSTKCFKNYILLMKEHNKKARCVDISILLWFYPLETFERVMSTRVFLKFPYTHTHILYKKLL